MTRLVATTNDQPMPRVHEVRRDARGRLATACCQARVRVLWLSGQRGTKKCREQA